MVILGALLILAGILVPGETWIGLLRPMPASPMREQLLLGAAYFRVVLAVLGVVLALLPRLPVWKRSPSPDLRKPWPERQSPMALAAIGGLLAIACALRLYKLGLGLWYDEVLTYVFYARMPFGEIVTTYHNENQHFLFTLLAQAAFRIFGEGAWALRLPAVLFGVASIGALYLFARQVGSTRQALFAAGLFTFSYHHVWFSQNARGYTGLLFWTLFSSWLLMRAMREGRKGLWLAYAAAVALGVYTHITMLFVVAGQGIAYLYDAWTRRRTQQDWWAGLLLGFGMAGLFTLTLHAMVIPQILAGMKQTVSVVNAWKKPGWTLLEILRGLQVNFAGAAVAIVALIVFAAGVWSFARKEFRVLILLFLPPAIGGGLVLAVGHHLWPRFFFFAFGFGALVAVRGAAALEETLLGWTGRPKREGAILCAGMVLVSALSVPFAFAPKQDYEGAIAYVRTATRPGDAVVLAGLIQFPYDNLYKPGWKTVSNAEELKAVRANAERTLVVCTLEPVLASMTPDIAASLKSDFRIMKKFPGTLQNGAISVYVAERAPAIAAF